MPSFGKPKSAVFNRKGHGHKHPSEVLVIMMKYDTNSDINKENKIVTSRVEQRTPPKTVLRTVMGWHLASSKPNLTEYICSYHEEA